MKLQTLTDICTNITFLQPEGCQSDMHQHPSDHRRRTISLHQSVEGSIDELLPVTKHLVIAVSTWVGWGGGDH